MGRNNTGAFFDSNSNYLSRFLVGGASGSRPAASAAKSTSEAARSKSAAKKDAAEDVEVEKSHHSPAHSPVPPSKPKSHRASAEKNDAGASAAPPAANDETRSTQATARRQSAPPASGAHKSHPDEVPDDVADGAEGDAGENAADDDVAGMTLAESVARVLKSITSQKGGASSMKPDPEADPIRHSVVGDTTSQQLKPGDRYADDAVMMPIDNVSYIKIALAAQTVDVRDVERAPFVRDIKVGDRIRFVNKQAIGITSVLVKVTDIKTAKSYKALFEEDPDIMVLNFPEARTLEDGLRLVLRNRCRGHKRDCSLDDPTVTATEVVAVCFEIETVERD